MAINTLEYAKIFQQELDKTAVQESVTGWMDANAGQVKYTGGDEVKIPKMALQGMADYDIDNGYEQGSVTLTYQTRQMTQDRGRLFNLDPREVDESNFIATAGNVMGEFQRTFVVPEIDAYRISKVASDAISAAKAGMITYGYTPSETNALRKLKEAIKAVRDNGYTGPLVCHATEEFALELEMGMAKQLTAITFSQGGVQTQVPSVDNVPIIRTATNKMYTAISIYDGKTTGQKQGGYVKGTTGKDINFILMARQVPIAITKLDTLRIFDPATNQKKNAWQLDYRRFHDLWTLDNKIDGVFVNIKDPA